MTIILRRKLLPIQMGMASYFILLSFIAKQQTEDERAFIIIICQQMHTLVLYTEFTVLPVSPTAQCTINVTTTVFTLLHCYIFLPSNGHPQQY